MPLQRRIQRQQLSCYLKVFNQITGKPVGYLGNVSLVGLLLISQVRVMVDARFDLRIKLPRLDGEERYVDFSALCLWSREDVTPGTYNSGFSLVEPPYEYVEMVAALQRYFSFRPLGAAV
ncbi:MAG: PilZ domain-containing protein [Pseudomonas sp.]